MSLIKIAPLLSVFLLVLAACAAHGQSSLAPLRHEPLRPQFHFTPAVNWMNDPNGMVYYRGTYHLFFQQNPDAPVPGNIHWGHATSPDLIHWTQQPSVLAPDSLGQIFSGSAVVDKYNTAGFGTSGQPALVAMYTNNDDAAQQAGSDTYENQSVAYSTDNGQTWTKYAQNPVLKNPGSKDFRDPKVIWYAPQKKWVVALAAHDRVDFYSSPNLKDWTKLSEFGADPMRGAHGGVWECPDLFPLKDDQGKQRWVLIVNINPGGPNGGSATQYFVGDFDGSQFTTTQPDTRWVDYGPDDYAGVTYSNAPHNRRIFIGWMGNWNYTPHQPTTPWRGAMIFPRELKLVTVNGVERLASAPVKELNQLFTFYKETGDIPGKGDFYGDIPQQNLPIAPLKRGGPGIAYERAQSLAQFDVDGTNDWSVTLSNKLGEQVIIGYDAVNNRYYLDRSRSGNVSFSPNFTPFVYAPCITRGKSSSINLLIDHSSVEMFADGGVTCLTATFFPQRPLANFAYHLPKMEHSGHLTFIDLYSAWP